MSNVSQHTKLITLRVPNELLAKVEEQRMGDETRTDVIINMMEYYIRSEAVRPPTDGTFW